MAIVILKILMTCLQKFEQNGGTCMELQWYILLSYIVSVSAEKEPLLIYEENSILQKKKIEHHLPIAVSDVTHTFVVVQVSSISACE